MSRLAADVAEMLKEQGLDIEEDRGGLLVRTGPGETPLSLWINENERVVRAEQVLAYPVDDFSGPLGRALDWLNLNRAGVCYSFQEAQRAVVGATVWTSPNRNPSPTQLHLLVALLMGAKQRDSSALARVAEGEGSWEEVMDTEQGVQPRDSGRHDPLTLRFTTSRFDPEELMGAGAGGWKEPPTRPLGRIADGSYAQSDRPVASGPQTAEWSAQESREIANANARRSDRYSRDALEGQEGDAPRDPTQPPKTSRMALALAVQQLERDASYGEQQDLTPRSGGLGWRIVKFLVIVAVLAWPVAWVFARTVSPLVPPKYRVWDPLLEKMGLPTQAGGARPVPTASGETALDERRMIPPGAQLLRAELEAPLEGGEDRVEISLKILGDERRGILETIIAQSPVSSARSKAYDYWVQHGYHEEEGSRLALLRQLKAVAVPRTDVNKLLVSSIAKRPPSDEELAKALEWAEPGLWRVIIERLGRPGEGAEERSKILVANLERDTKDLVVLRALVRTGFAGPNALTTLLNERGLEWCADSEGRELIVSLLRKHPNAANSLLVHAQVEVATFAVEVIGEAGGPAAINKLIEIMRDKGEAPYKTWIRQKAVTELQEITPSQATWPLVYVLNTKDTPESLLDAVQRCLRTYNGKQGTEDLERYTVSKRSSTRRYAITGLAAMGNPAPTERLIQRLTEEPDYRVRRLVVSSLGELQKVKRVRTTLQKALSTFRSVSRNDEDAQVRREAERLYRSLAGR